MIIIILIGFIIFSFIIYFVYKKQAQTNLEKLLVEILSATCITILIVWYLDKYNIPTMLGIANNIDTKIWFNFIIDFLIAMLGTFISAILVLATTMGQIERTEQKEQETFRINNMPFLEYKINIVNNILNIKFKNIGNNIIKKYFIKINKKNILTDYQNCLSINEESKITYKLSLDENKIQVIVEYQDLLYNIYEQKIDITYTVNKENKISINEVIIEDEKLKKIRS